MKDNDILKGIVTPQFEYKNNVENPKIDPEFKKQEQERKQKRLQEEEIKAERLKEIETGIYEATWVQVELPDGTTPYICDNCKTKPLLYRYQTMDGTYIDKYFSKYCPNCGKKMQPPLHYKPDWNW